MRGIHRRAAGLGAGGMLMYQVRRWRLRTMRGARGIVHADEVMTGWGRTIAIAISRPESCRYSVLLQGADGRHATAGGDDVHT